VFKDYVSNLKMEAKKLTPKEFLTNPGEWLNTIGGVTKSIAASMDNSFFGRQGMLTLVSEPSIWLNNFAKSWGDMAKEIKGVDAMLPIKADIYSRPNAINGKYQAMKIDIGITSEEAYPSSLPEKIPLLGKLFKASESAYNGAALRIRADLADRMIAEAESMEINPTDKDAKLGEMINSMTGRGKVNLTPEYSKFVNVAFFSVKYLKSQIDMITAPLRAVKTIGKDAKKPGVYATRKAAKNMLKLISVIGGILALAKKLDPDSVEEDPRSTRFGKIWVGKNHDIAINITAGFSSLATLAARLIPTMHRGEWGFWYKTSKGKYIRLNTPKYGQPTWGQVLLNFFEGKTSPISRAIIDQTKGENFSGEKPTIENVAKNLLTPIPAQNFDELLKSSAGDDILFFSLLSGLDLLGVNTNVKKERKKKNSKPKWK
jgi:hypothetical protein